MTIGIEIIRPDWPAPAGTAAAFTLRAGGVSSAPFDSLNVGLHTGDEPRAVIENRRRVRAALELPAEPVWLAQVHGTAVLRLEEGVTDGSGAPPMADAVITRTADRVCAIQVADCMPVLIAADDGSAVGAAHAGWRGLAGGVLEATVHALGEEPYGVQPDRLITWMGPAIGPGHFEVGEEVRSALLASDPAAGPAFTRNARWRWQCDLYALARRRLERLGVRAIYGGGWCTHADPARFFSYRRDGQCGRMAALLWMECKQRPIRETRQDQ